MGEIAGSILVSTFSAFLPFARRLPEMKKQKIEIEKRQIRRKTTMKNNKRQGN